MMQHLLEHGKPHERTAIINKLTGQIVQMSQQKFASNVIEKCLSFGTLAERQSVVNEMLGSTNENDPLQVRLLFFSLVAFNLKILLLSLSLSLIILFVRCIVFKSYP